MGSKILIGAVGAALAVCGAVWSIARNQNDSLALAAPERVEPRVAEAPAELDVPHETRSAALDPEPPEIVETAAQPEPLAQREIARLIEDLRHDEIKGNARRAVEALSAAGPEVLEPLQRALRSNDWQQRQLSGHVLACRRDAPPSQALADVLVEGLGGDDLGAGPIWHEPIDIYTGFDLQGWSREVLSSRPALFALALPNLARRVESSHAGLRFAAARVFAAQRSEVARERVLAVLLEHLEDNDDDKDARIALPAIAGFGADALPLLESHFPGRDEQQRALLGHLIWLSAPASACARELKPEGFHALGFVPWKELPLERCRASE